MNLPKDLLVVSLLLHIFIASVFAEKASSDTVLTVLRPSFSNLDRSEGDLVWKLFENELTQLNFTVVDRERLNQALDELSLQEDGITNRSISRIGHLIGSDYFIETGVAKLGAKKLATVRVIDIQTSRTLGDSFVVGADTSPLDVIEPLAKKTVKLLERLGAFSVSAEEASFVAPELSAALSGKRFAVVIPEEHLPNPIPDPAAETKIISRLLALGFKVSDLSDQSVSNLAENNNRVSRLLTEAARSADVDLLVIGEAVSETAGRLRDFVRTQGRVEIRIIEVASGEILYAGSVTRGHTSTSALSAGKQALEKSADILTSEFLAELSAQFQ
ncbi:MAG: hypothetical protein EA353_11775 [Puniceicoccaceae bacterium]|nr:MAG: hypothetical protein EA353_11775 [Puniceicoccaceae bacterium]